ncbi:conserved hypothetical protein [uncultured Alphaproteobacteria bacterium]|uniref:Polysaccharide pyruvyl transferase domain-containing protein n=1 Tax=uncultured Alphaproteobacteria bacterium TaxID=91750 RepID=A0A212J794_9PROT|nr:conserved hypothetical protein [uncultured Alphaproteobacteria bacterium]
MTILVFNDRFSANVGDGLLAEALLHHLRAEVPEIPSLGVDIDGKTGYAAGEDRRGWKRCLPVPFALRRRLRCRAAYRRVRARIAAIRSETAGISAIVIGGGQLITATSDYFPARLSAVLDDAREHRVPVYVHAVGVSEAETWQAADARLLARALTDRTCLRRAAVRDTRSKRLWDLLAPEVPAALAPDPGIVADALPHRRGEPDPERVGIGVMAPKVVREIMKAEDGAGVAFYRDLCGALADRGLRLRLFTNGDPGDETFLDALMADGAVAGIAERAPRPRDPAALLEIVGGCGAIAAHRMHANIAAYALGVPHVGLGWDPKLEGFFALSGRSGFLVGPGPGSATRAADAVARALATPWDEARRRQVRAHAVRAVADLAAAIRADVGGAAAGAATPVRA